MRAAIGSDMSAMESDDDVDMSAMESDDHEQHDGKRKSTEKSPVRRSRLRRKKTAFSDSDTDSDAPLTRKLYFFVFPSIINEMHVSTFWRTLLIYLFPTHCHIGGIRNHTMC